MSRKFRLSRVVRLKPFSLTFPRRINYSSEVRASWRYLGLVGLIGGGPTFLGTLVGLSFHNQYVYVAFLALAGGAILYVVAELLHTGRRLAAWEMTLWGVLGGFLVGVATELVIVAARG